MIINRLQGNDLAAPVPLEGALLELLQLAEGLTSIDTTAQITTTFGDDTMTASVSLPIQYANSADGTIIVYSSEGSLPTPSSNQ